MKLGYPEAIFDYEYQRQSGSEARRQIRGAKSSDVHNTMFEACLQSALGTDRRTRL